MYYFHLKKHFEDFLRGLGVERHRSCTTARWSEDPALEVIADTLIKERSKTGTITMPRDPREKLERLLTFQKFLEEHFEEQRQAAQRPPTRSSTSCADDAKLGKEQKKVVRSSDDHAQQPQARAAPKSSAEGKSGSLLLTGPQDPASSTAARTMSPADPPEAAEEARQGE